MCGHSVRNGRVGFSFLVQTISKNALARDGQFFFQQLLLE
jgi:hypothetical protein